MSNIARLGPTRILNRTHFGQLLRLTRRSAGLTTTDAHPRHGIGQSTLITRELGTRRTYIDDAIDMLAEYGYGLEVVPLAAPETRAGA